MSHDLNHDFNHFTAMTQTHYLCQYIRLVLGRFGVLSIYNFWYRFGTQKVQIKMEFLFKRYDYFRIHDSKR